MVDTKTCGSMSSEAILMDALEHLNKELMHWSRCSRCLSTSLPSEAHRLARLA